MYLRIRCHSLRQRCRALAPSATAASRLRTSLRWALAAHSFADMYTPSSLIHTYDDLARSPRRLRKGRGRGGIPSAGGGGVETVRSHQSMGAHALESHCRSRLVRELATSQVLTLLRSSELVNGAYLNPMTSPHLP